LTRHRTARIALALAATCTAAAVIAPAAASARSFTADVSNFAPYNLTAVDSRVDNGTFLEQQFPTIKAHSQHRDAFGAESNTKFSSLTGRVTYAAQAGGFSRPSGHVTIEFGVPYIGFDSADCYVDQGLKDAQIQCRVPRAPSGDDPRVEFVVEKVPPKQ
jgi:hypothetical protein